VIKILHNNSSVVEGVTRVEIVNWTPSTSFGMLLDLRGGLLENQTALGRLQ
jgi:hypothetical protein